MTYEGSAHRTPEEQAIVAAHLRKLAADRESRKRARRRENIEDAILVLVVAVVALLVGIRVERVYLHEEKPADPHAVETSGHDVP